MISDREAEMNGGMFVFNVREDYERDSTYNLCKI